jgi:hypothetical protein
MADPESALCLQWEARTAIAARSTFVATIRAGIEAYPGHFVLWEALDSRDCSKTCCQGKPQGRNIGAKLKRRTPWFVLHEPSL